MSTLERGTLLSSRSYFEGRVFNVEVDEIEVKGHRTIREIVRHPGGVVVLAVKEDGTIPFVRQHRYPPNLDLLELPAGKIDRGEDPQTGAARELEEETGLRPRKIELILRFYSSPGFCDELLYCYYADDLETVEASPEVDEHLQLEFLSLDEALEMADAGEIVDAKTLTALYWLYRQRSIANRNS